MPVTYITLTPQNSTSETGDMTQGTATAIKFIRAAVLDAQATQLQASDTGVQQAIELYPEPALLKTTHSRITVKRNLAVKLGTQSSEIVTDIAALLTTGYEVRASGELTYQVGSTTSKFNGSAWVHGDSLNFRAQIEGSNLSGLTLYFDAVEQSDPTTVVLSKTVGSGVQMTQPSEVNGVDRAEALISIDTSTLSGVDSSTRATLKYHCWLSDGQGRTYTIEQGSFTLETKF